MPEDIDASLLEAVEAIYGCVADPSGYERLPEIFASVMDALNITVWCMDTDFQPAIACNHGLPERAVNDYLEYWIDNDPLMDSTLQSHVGQLVTPERVLGDRAYRQLPVYDGFYAKYGLVRQMARFDRITPNWLAGVAFQRGTDYSPICESDQRRLQVLAQHLRRAWSISIRMGILSARASGAEQLLSSCRLATWLLDAQRRVHAANEAAEGITAISDSGIVDVHGSLRFGNGELDAAFAEAIRRSVTGKPRPVELPLPGNASHDFAWGVLIPIDRDHHGSGHVETLYLLVLARHGADADVRWQRLEHRLPISRAEADVLARLMRAEDLPTIADARGSTLETIRGYEKSLRTKLCCHSRAQLVTEGWRTLATIPNP